MAGKRKTVKSGTTSETTQSASTPKATKATKPAAKKAAPEVVMTVSHDQIARRAYEIWLAKGCPQGTDHQNWAEAKADLKA